MRTLKGCVITAIQIQAAVHVFMSLYSKPWNKSHVSSTTLRFSRMTMVSSQKAGKTPLAC